MYSATSMKYRDVILPMPLRKNLGKKNCELSEEDIQRICQTFLDYKETEQSKIFPNEAFGYWKVNVERPLRLRVDSGTKSLSAFRATCAEEGETPLANAVDRIAGSLGPEPHLNSNAFMDAVDADTYNHNINLTAARKKLLKDRLAKRDETAVEVISKIHKPSKTKPDPLRGLFETTINGQPGVVEYEPDSELRDTEQIPLLEEGGIEAFIRREVLPHAINAWHDNKSVKTGFEISFTRYFFKPQLLRTLKEIRADILALEKETEGLLGESIGENDQ